MNGLVTLITGGAAGLGLACAKRFARQGARVIICDLPSSKGNEVVNKWSLTFASSSNSALNEPEDNTTSQLNEDPFTVEKTNTKNSSSNQLSIKPVFFPADVTNEEQIKATVNKIKQDYGKLDVVLNCVGIGMALRTYNINKHSMHDLEKFRRILNINVSGTFNVIRWACHIMADNQPDAQGQRGVIVNTASIAAYEGQIGQVAYAASKGAIVSMTLPLARDLSNMGVRVCAIAPGVFHTPMLATLPEKVRILLGHMVPFPSRLGRSDDFARLAQTIVENPYLNGEVIRLDGALRLPP
jgi:3-hydroxyacyl-CoA dehydrogenase/3-hydroxy-2-methylbutyryl-CoA dehydrogenase